MAISDASLGSLVPILDRYRPVAVSITVILLAIAVLPGADRDAGGPQLAAPANATTPARPLGDPTADDDHDAATAPAPDLHPTVASRTPVLEPTTQQPTRSSSPAAPPPTSFEASPSLTGESTTGATADEPLMITASGWASAQAGTPLADAGVPEGTLPVGTRLGQLDKASFIRLSGSETSLVLAANPKGSRGVEAPAVALCRVVDAGWAPEEAQSFDDAPQWDDEACVDGIGTDDGRWTFDLSVFDSVDDDRGFALVPGADAPIDFQVAFEPNVVAG